MKTTVITALGFIALLTIVGLDNLVVLMLAGVIPGTDIVLSPSTMAAVPIASALMLPLIHHRRDVMKLSYRIYDSIIRRKKRKSADDTNNLPLRRYGQI